MFDRNHTSRRPYWTSYPYKAPPIKISKMNVQDIEQNFFRNNNVNTIVNAVLKTAQDRGAELTQNHLEKAQKIVVHYIDAVWEREGPLPIQTLNKIVYGESLKVFIRTLSQPAPQKPVQAKPVQPKAKPVQAPPPYSVDERYTKLQEERNAPKEKLPPIPNFQISLESDKDGPTPAELYEHEMKKREEEAARVQAELDAKGAEKGHVQVKIPEFAKGFGGSFINAEDEMSAHKSQEDPRKKTKVEEEEINSMMNMGSIYRSMVSNEIPRDPIANPTIARPDMLSNRSVQQMDTLIRQDPIVSYKEHEDNLFLYSADRDWVNDDTQSRYNFTINFDTANNKQGFNKNLSVVQRFKNISRIELVKAILPIEGLETFFEVDASGSGGLETGTFRRVSLYQFPFVMLRIPELDVNNYGSDDNLNNSFGVLQYDAEWNTDGFSSQTSGNFIDKNSPGGTGNMGYTTFIPKHLKCQKIYQPTPLATLSKLSIELERPDGSTLSTYSDTIDISSVAFNNTSAVNTSLYYGSNIVDSASNSYYIILRTKKFFSRWMFSVGDRVQLGGLTSQISGITEASKHELFEFLQDPTGHVIAGVGFDTGGVKDGYNTFGYANWIAIRAPINDPTTGLTTVRTIGDADYSNLVTNLTSATFTKGRILNQSHQTQLVFRVITREMDSAGRVRPDNL